MGRQANGDCAARPAFYWSHRDVIANPPFTRLDDNHIEHMAMPRRCFAMRHHFASQLCSFRRGGAQFPLNLKT
jgi:hypothetical protein